MLNSREVSETYFNEGHYYSLDLQTIDTFLTRAIPYSIEQIYPEHRIDPQVIKYFYDYLKIEFAQSLEKIHLKKLGVRFVVHHSKKHTAIKIVPHLTVGIGIVIAMFLPPAAALLYGAESATSKMAEYFSEHFGEGIAGTGHIAVAILEILSPFIKHQSSTLETNQELIQRLVSELLLDSARRNRFAYLHAMNTVISHANILMRINKISYNTTIQVLNERFAKCIFNFDDKISYVENTKGVSNPYPEYCKKQVGKTPKLL